MALKINGEPIALADSPAQRANTGYAFEALGEATAEYRLTELDQTDPAGRYRFRVSGDALLFERATQPDWADWETFITIDKDGVILLEEDAVEDQLAVLLLQVTALRELVELAVA